MAIRQRPVTGMVDRVLSGGQDLWGSMGQSFRRKYIREEFGGHDMNPERTILDFIRRGRCRMLFLGSSRAQDIPMMIKCISDIAKEDAGKKMIIDTESKKYINRDYTPKNPTAFEHYENPKMIGAYDIVLAQQSVGWHTLEPSWTMVKAANLLDEGEKHISSIIPK